MTKFAKDLIRGDSFSAPMFTLHPNKWGCTANRNNGLHTYEIVHLERRIDSGVNIWLVDLEDRNTLFKWVCHQNMKIEINPTNIPQVWSSEYNAHICGLHR